MSKRLTINDLNDRQAHFVLVPLMAPGHMIPMIDLARLLAERGVLVTVIITPLNASRIQKTIDRVKDSGSSIRFVRLRFPCQEAGLPEGCENVDVLPAEFAKNFFEASKLLQQPLENYLRDQQPYPSCIVADSCHAWTQKVSRKLGIPRLCFYGVCCFYLLCSHNISQYKVYDSMTNEMEPFTIPGLTHEIEVTKAQAPGFLPGPEWDEIRQEIIDAELAADSVIVNSFDDLEPSYVERYQKAVGKRVWTLGPLSLSNKEVSDVAERGNRASIDMDQCLKWLDSMKPKSVVYVCFGSLTHTTTSQLIEIGCGLEAANYPFIWMIKACEQSPELEKWLSEGFEERTSTRSLIIKGWASQMMILSHPAIGGFITHCGWNSSIESVAAGVPMITWPCFADQFLNERLIVDVLKIGVKVGVEVPSHWGLLNNELLVKRDDIEKAVHRLMGEGEEATERRERVGEIKEKAMKAMDGGGSSYVNMTLLIEYVSAHAKKSMRRGKEI